MTIPSLRQGAGSAGRDAGSHRRGAEARRLRIIGGAWRGRKLQFAPGSPIRPTPDRVRETLFNWLGPSIAGARCLDLFAGSGALGLEALSRGARAAVFVERDRAAARDLERLLVKWGGAGGRVVKADALGFLRGRDTQRMPDTAAVATGGAGDAGGTAAQAAAFDMVFLDPPFDAGLLAPAAAALEERGWLCPEARIYVECAARQGLPALPPDWAVHRAGRAGEVGYHLLTRSAAPE